ncbi:MAG: cellulase family glycosylhydrolase [Bacteroidales bacterium]|nr:cellulase family glycosylhydrolase [Bacteroidales bacterium]
METQNRRDFLRQLALGSGALIAAPDLIAESLTNLSTKKDNIKNNLPCWRGFNALDFFRPEHYSRLKDSNDVTSDDDLKWMADWGFDFLRIPIAYPSYLKFDSNKENRHITPEEVMVFNREALDAVENLVYRANKAGLHVSLNLHRAPGYCINAGFNEPYNLWNDKEAQQAFNSHWEMWSKRFKNVSSKKLSFDLVNEPLYKEDMNDQFSPSKMVDGNVYRHIAENALNVIHSISSKRIVIADGNGGGGVAVPELVGLNISQSCRGYFPGFISHYKASWVYKDPAKAPKIEWPGNVEGKYYDRNSLVEFYKPWKELINKGVGVHCGECGCFNKTPHPIFLGWMEDLLSVLKENNIGWGIWNFRGSFGLLDSGREDVDYEDWHSHKLDKKMLRLLQKY